MSIDSLKQDIDLINEFSANYTNKTATLNTKLINTLQNLDAVLNDERQNEAYLSGLQNKLSEIELQNSLQNLLKLKETLNTKFNDYNNIIQNNTKRINEISIAIKQNKELLNNIYSLVKTLEHDTGIIDEKLVR